MKSLANPSLGGSDYQYTNEGLEKQSVRLQRKVSSILKALVFDTPSSTGPIVEALAHFEATEGCLGQHPPLDFLSVSEQALFTDVEIFRTSLYKIDLELRQRIEKQLNKVELANRFSKAVFFANNQEFQDGTRDEQEISTACKVLIQNAIVLWNTLYLLQRLSSVTAAEEKREMLTAITSGSLLTWQHVNLQGEYDFRQLVSYDEPFDMGKIRALRLF